MGLRPMNGAKIPKFVETEDIDTIGKLTNGLIHQREVVNGLSNSFRELFGSLNIGFTHATSIFQMLFQMTQHATGCLWLAYDKNLSGYPIASFKYCLMRSRFEDRLENCFSHTSLNLASTLRFVSS